MWEQPPSPQYWRNRIKREARLFLSDFPSIGGWGAIRPYSSAATANSQHPGGSRVSYQGSLYPIVLGSPNSSFHPEKGDGQNQFVYDAAAVQGHLNVPAIISVPGSLAADTSWLAPNAGILYDLPSDSHQEMNVTIIPTAGLISAQTTYMIQSGPYTVSGYEFSGLPASNGGFGNHLATLKVNSTSAQQAHVQTFFTAGGSNWPGTDSSTFNWYNYYNQVSSSGGTFSSADGKTDTHQLQDQHGNRTAYSIFYNTSNAIRVFGLNSNVSPYVVFLGYLYTGGIHSYIYVCAHEAGHRAAWTAAGIEYVYGGYGNKGSYYDLVPAWKTSHHFQYMDINGNVIYDTTGAYANIPSKGGPPDPGDTECIADIQALQPLLGSLADWQVDWADNGLQSGSPYFFQNGKADFYWRFYPDTSKPVHVAPTGSPNSDGSYHVASLQDLSNVYPGTTILTTLSQLN